MHAISFCRRQGSISEERRRSNARLADARFELRANNVVILEFLALWVCAVMADFEGNYPMADAQYRELLSLWHQNRTAFAIPGVVSAAGFYAGQGGTANMAACCEIVGMIELRTA
jgi:hypothetical protein